MVIVITQYPSIVCSSLSIGDHAYMYLIKQLA